MILLKTLNATTIDKRILAHIHEHGPASRQGLARDLGLTLLTISKAVTALLERGVLTVEGTVSGGMGRRASLLVLNPQHTGVIGVDIGYATIKLGLIRFDGTLKEKAVIENPGSPLQDGVPLSEMMRVIEGWVAREGRENLLGIGASISGMVDFDAGRVLFCANIAGFDDRPLARELSEATGLPVSLDTSARCMALGESHFGGGVGVRDQVFLSLGAGSIAAGILCGGQLYRGADGFAGEIGHNRTHMPGVGEQRCSCGGVDCLELYATEFMALQRVEQELAGYGGYSPARNLMQGGALTTRLMAEAYRQGDQIVVEQIDYVADAVGAALGALANTLNPSLVTLGGGFIHRFDALYGLIQTKARRACVTPLRGRLAVRKSELGEDAPLLGSAMHMIRQYIR